MFGGPPPLPGQLCEGEDSKTAKKSFVLGTLLLFDTSQHAFIIVMELEGGKKFVALMDTASLPSVSRWLIVTNARTEFGG